MTRILVACVITLSASVQAGRPIFGTPQPLDVGPGSGDIAIADLDRDGHLDILTKHLLQQRLTVSLGDGAGRFTRGEGSLQLAFGPGAVALADMDGDGNSDLLIAARHDGAELAGVYPGNGRGGFRTTALVRLGDAMPYYKPVILAADLNEDGRMDLVAANGRRNTIEVLTGDGRGGFGPVTRITLRGGHDRYHMLFADLNADGHLDLISTRGDQGLDPTRVTVALGDGKGQFREHQDLGGLAGARVEAAADLNGDGHADVILSHAAPRITVLLNDGRGTLAVSPDSPIALGHETHQVVLHDVNGDGRTDLAAATNHTVTVLLNEGGRLSPRATTFPAGPGAFQLAVADLNRDRRPDLVASSFEGNALTLLFGR